VQVWSDKNGEGKEMSKNVHKKFISGNEAVAEGVRLSRPHVISAYPITPQTTVVERLADMVANGRLKTEYMYVESEHSALSSLIGASALGARTFTASSSQGLLYMAECLHYASGGRFPIVMMNANRSVALPWNILGDQRDSLSLLDSGWIQAYAADAQEALDLTIQAFAVAEHPSVLTPFMVNLDGFVLTHTYEAVDIPEQEAVDEFLPKFDTTNKMDINSPKSLGFTAGALDNTEFKYLQHKAMIMSAGVIKDIEERFERIFKRKYTGLLETFKTEDAEFILITLGSVAGTVKPVIEQLRAQGVKAGLVRLRYIRPFPAKELSSICKNVKTLGVLEKDISFGYEGTVFTNVKSALFDAGLVKPSHNFIAGLGGRDIPSEDILKMFNILTSAENSGETEKIHFIGLKQL
jgi:pyruvate ferredoxin oxidoreductase alpha subunit